ncbi:MAG: RidA family protein [Phycisphaerales bacterium]|nr:RidA family protein [Phycisphaerales bacterium]
MSDAENRRRHAFSGTLWEEQVGYSRAIRAGDLIFITGTVAAHPDGSIISPGDPRAQSEAIFDKIQQALQELDSTLEDIVRTRIFITDMAHAQAVGDVHARVLGHVRPATTMVVVSELFGAGSVVEIEADAVRA